jgi:hypothetical protein
MELTFFIPFASFIQAIQNIVYWWKFLIIINEPIHVSIYKISMLCWFIMQHYLFKYEKLIHLIVINFYFVRFISFNFYLFMSIIFYYNHIVKIYCEIIGIMNNVIFLAFWAFVNLVISFQNSQQHDVVYRLHWLLLRIRRIVLIPSVDCTVKFMIFLLLSFHFCFNRIFNFILVKIYLI